MSNFLNLRRPFILIHVIEANQVMTGLEWTTDHMPGFSRRRSGRGFAYLDDAGAPLRDAPALARTPPISTSGAMAL